MPLHDTSYQHWQGVHQGVWHRRWVITYNGLRACFVLKVMQYWVLVCWVAGLLVAGLLFLIGQLLVPDSLAVRTVSTMDPNLQTLVRFLTSWLQDHPQISVQTVQTVVFYFFGLHLLKASIFTMGMTLPHLVTRDLASNAIIIYSSKAINRWDYLLGKFCIAAGLFVMTWLGPMCAAWFLGNLLAPDWRFFWHSRAVLGAMLAFGVVAMLLLSLLSLGLSAISSGEKTTTATWFAWWLLGGVIAGIAVHTRPWLRFLSFNYDLAQIQRALFHPGREVEAAKANIPVLGDMLKQVSNTTMDAFNNPPWQASLVFLLAMMALAAFIIHKRVKPE